MLQFRDEFGIFSVMSRRKEEDLGSQERRSDEELQAVLAENTTSIASLNKAGDELTKLREVLYREHIAPIDAKLLDVRTKVSQHRQTMNQAEIELRANQKDRETQEHIRFQAEKRRLAVEGRRIYVDGLRQRLTDSADTLDKKPVELPRRLAGALRKVVEHPNFDESATSKIRVRGKDGLSMRIILGEADSQYFLSYNPPHEGQTEEAKEAVRQITKEIGERGGFEGTIVRNFIGFRVDTSDNHPVIPFVLVRHDKLRTSRMLLPESAVDERFAAPLGVISDMVQHGEISLPKLQV